MKSVLQHDFGKDWTSRIQNRLSAKTFIRVNGSPRKPPQPRGVRFVIRDGVGVLVWEKPLRAHSTDITGYQIYRNTETEPVARIADKNTTQTAVDMPNSGSVNFYIATVNGLREGPRIHVQGKLS